MNLTRLAEQYARKYHDGQYRRSSNLPYYVHPKHVVGYLEKFGINDQTTKAIGWLHDTIEDTELNYKQIKHIFGKRIAEGVNYLTRNVDRQTYKNRLKHAPKNVMMVKLCDTLDNIKTLHCLSAKGIERKVNDCREFYIPMAQKLCPAIADRMEYHFKRQNIY